MYDAICVAAGPVTRTTRSPPLVSKRRLWDIVSKVSSCPAARDLADLKSELSMDLSCRVAVGRRSCFTDEYETVETNRTLLRLFLFVHDDDDDCYGIYTYVTMVVMMRMISIMMTTMMMTTMMMVILTPRSFLFEINFLNSQPFRLNNTRWHWQYVWDSGAVVGINNVNN